MGGILQIGGAIVGGVIGFVVGGPMGAAYGAAIGYGVGTMFTPLPDVQQPGQPVEKTVMKSSIGGPCPDVCGTSQITGHLLCYGAERYVQLYAESEGGKGGGGKGGGKQEAGREYYMSWCLGFCVGPVGCLHAIYLDDDIEPIYADTLLIPTSGGEETIVLDGIGTVVFYFGTADQVPNSKVAALLEDSNLNTPYRNYCWMFCDDCMMGNSPRCPSVSVVVSKIPEYSFITNPTLNLYDSNPAAILYYILHDLAGLPDTWLYEDDYSDLADSLYLEDRGMSVLFRDQNSVMSYLEMVNNHIDGILRYGSDGKFHYKLIREDYDIGTLPLIDKEVLLEDPTLTRRSWIDTINEMKVQYTQLIGVPILEPTPLPPGQWVASLEQRDTDYVYLYDITNYAVIKIDTSATNPMVVDYLVINDSSYNLDYNKGEDSAKHGSYCMSKDYNKIWYLFRNGSGDIKLVEVKITTYPMEIIQTSFHSGILDTVSSSDYDGYAGANYEHFTDGCGNDDYAFFATTLESGRIIRFDTAHTLVDTLFSYAYTSIGDECIRSMTLNPATNEIMWVYARGDPFMTIKVPYASYALVVAGTYSELDGGVDSGQRHNFLRYDEKYDFIFHQRSYYPSNGIGWYYPDWDMVGSSASRSSISLELMQQYLGGNMTYFYALKQNSTVNDSVLYRIEHPTSPVSLTRISINVDAYCRRFGWTGLGDGSHVSIYNELNDKSFLFAYNSADGKNYIASFNSSLTLVSDYAPDTIYWNGMEYRY